MERCIALAIQAVDVGEYPYAAVICRDGEFISEGINSARQDRDVTHHAEIVVMKQALSRLDQVSLEDCTIYTNAEPCALCSYAMRETRIGRVVFGVPAPLTGGLSRWKILAVRRTFEHFARGLCAATGDCTRLRARTGRGSDGQADSNNLGLHSGAEHFWRSTARSPPREAAGQAQGKFPGTSDVFPSPAAIRLSGSQVKPFAPTPGLPARRCPPPEHCGCAQALRSIRLCAAHP